MMNVESLSPSRGRSHSPNRRRPRSERHSLSIGRALSPSRRRRSLEEDGEQERYNDEEDTISSIQLNSKTVEIGMTSTVLQMKRWLSFGLFPGKSFEEEKEAQDSASFDKSGKEEVEIEPSLVRRTSC
jgi:hypothetical protein